MAHAFPNSMFIYGSASDEEFNGKPYHRRFDYSPVREDIVKSHSKKTSSRTARELLAVAAVSTLVYVLAQKFDLIEWFFQALRPLEQFELDELILAFFIFCAGAAFVLGRRAMGLKQNLAQLESQTGELRTSERSYREQFEDEKGFGDSLRRRDEYIRSLIEQAPLVVYEVGEGGTLLSTNAAGFAIAGIEDRSAISKMSILDLIVEDDRPMIRQKLEEAFAGRMSEFECRTERSGNIQTLAANFFAFQSPEREVSKVLAVMRDVSALKQSEADLLAERNFINTVLESIGSLVLVLDPQGRIVSFNKSCEELSGYRFKDVKGKIFWECLVPEDQRASFLKVFSDLRPERFPNEFENEWIRKDGEISRISWLNTADLNPDGSVRHVISAGIDITEKRKLESDLQQSQKMDAVGQLAGGLAHDFNNLLTAIHGYAEMVKGELDPASPMAEDVQEICDAADRGADLTRQLLSFSRKQLLEPAEVDLNQVVSDIKKMLLRLIGENYELCAELDADLHPVEIDSGQLEQVLVNLVLNARDATPDGGSITIRTRCERLNGAPKSGQADVPPGVYTILEVEDRGVGMNKRAIDRIFEPFFTTKARGKGTGLGLSIVYGIVRQSGGTIRVDSEPGRGTRFQLYFPVASLPEVEAPLPAPVPVIASEPNENATILLVDDEAVVRKLAYRLLEKVGYTVLEACDAQHAIEVARLHKEAIDLLLTDIVMPGIHGQELAAQLAESRPEMKILFMSGYTDNPVIGEGSTGGDANFLAKPFTPSILRGKVEEVLKK